MITLLKNKTDRSIKIFDTPDDLPDGWDQAFPPGDIFNKTIMLRHLHKTNSAIQKYFWKDIPGQKPLAGTIWFAKLPFAVGPLTFYKPVTVCSIPMPSVAEPGFSDVNRLKEVTEIMDCFGSGFQITSGSQQNGLVFSGWAWKRYLVNVDMDTSWSDFDEYCNNLRSPYRSRISDALKVGEKLEAVIISPEKFNENLYGLYEKIATRFKSLALSQDFFTSFPIKSYILGLTMEGVVIAWALLVPSGSCLYFLFGGFDEKLNQKYQIYNNLLLSIVRFSIERGYKILNLGQTAELSKMRLGGMPSEQYILVRHTNYYINWIINNTDIFSYRKRYPIPNVFKGSVFKENEK